MDIRRFYIAAFLCMALVVVWTMLFPAEPPVQVQAASEGAGRPAAEAPAAPEGSDRAAPLPGATLRPAPAAPARPIVAAREETVTLRQGDSEAVFTNRGAQLVSLEVGADTEGKQGIDLVRKRREGPYPYGLTTGDRRSHPLNEQLFAVERSADGRSVLFRYNGPQGAAEKRFSFTPEGLLQASVRLPGHRGWGLVLGPGVRNLPPDELTSSFQVGNRGVVYRTGEVNIISPKGADEVQAFSGSALRWIGLEDTYFLSAAVLDDSQQGGLARAVIEPVLLDGAGTEAGARFIPVPEDLTSEQKDMARDFRLVLKPEGDTLSFLSYWGPKEYDRLASHPYGLEETVRLGIFGFLARGLLTGLRWIYDNMVANYGWAIVVMTILIRLLLLPLTHHSMKSMKKMQELNPKMQAIREKYRPKLKDKQGRPNVEMQQKLNQEMMGLYKEHGVNPAGGCFPLLLQLPILFAFYSLLSTAVELRGAPWLLWIRDLSEHDPYYVLPILMGATQFLQVKLAPPMGDPMQRRLFMMMPIVMTFMFLGFPSGLVLYWLTNNVLTILQQGVYNRLQGSAVGESTKTAHQRG
ncbi:MAG TPA: membrane protein insertase YidC [Thermoanaerobaculia bacterium]|nr:membrane protein insertase YidC [Thermoanaerobaculia bacterium]